MTKRDVVFTNQRQAILEELRGRTDHPAVDQVHSAVRERLPRTSKATVYNNLRYLTERGLISEVNVRGAARYEANTRPHHHLVCTACHRIVDFHSDDLIDHSLDLFESEEGYRVDSATTTFYGPCSRCR